MVNVVDTQDIAFSGRWKFNPRQQKDNNESSDDESITPIE
jgi:hypothetical protein